MTDGDSVQGQRLGALMENFEANQIKRQAETAI